MELRVFLIWLYGNLLPFLRRKIWNSDKLTLIVAHSLFRDFDFESDFNLALTCECLWQDEWLWFLFVCCLIVLLGSKSSVRSSAAYKFAVGTRSSDKVRWLCNLCCDPLICTYAVVQSWLGTLDTLLLSLLAVDRTGGSRQDRSASCSWLHNLWAYL